MPTSGALRVRRGLPLLNPKTHFSWSEPRLCLLPLLEEQLKCFSRIMQLPSKNTYQGFRKRSKS